MRRRVVLAVVLALIAGACAGRSDDATGSTAPTEGPVTITSPDGRLTLESSTSGITVEASSEATDFGDDVTTLASYELGPSGTEFDDPVTITFDTGISLDDGPVPFLTVLLTDDGEEFEALSPVEIVQIEGELVLSAEVPHFSRLVINRSDFGMWIEPPYVDTVVGAVWDGYWDLYDAKNAHIINEPARWAVVYDETFGPHRGRIRTLREETDVAVAPLATGIVQPLTGFSFVDAFDYLPYDDEGFGFKLLPESWVEIFFGYQRFTCRTAGEGTYGFAVDVVVDRSDLVFGARFGNRLALIRPSDGVRFHYEIDAPARCRDAYGRSTGLLSGYYGIGANALAGFVAGIVEDTMMDGIYSRSDTMPGVYVPAADLWDVGSLRVSTTPFRNQYLTNNSVFECGATVDMPALGGPVTTVCADDPPPIEGDVVIIAAQYSDLLPGEGATEYYTYAAVFESNDDPSDDWQFQGAFDWDLYRDTDQWYQIHFDPGSGTWFMGVTRTLDHELPSAARALIIGDTLIWIIPASEFASANPHYRVTSFVHDGSYAPEASMGDVNGADPTQPLLPVGN